MSKYRPSMMSRGQLIAEPKCWRCLRMLQLYGEQPAKLGRKLHFVSFSIERNTAITLGAQQAASSPSLYTSDVSVRPSRGPGVVKRKRAARGLGPGA